MGVHRVLIIEDDPDIGALVRLHAADLPAETRIETTGPRGLFAAQGGTWDLIVLDWRLPGLDGVTLCRRLREQRHPGPILMMSARASEADRVAGLDAGADDYVAKPFGMSELKARMRAQLRRAERSAGAAADEVETSHLRIGPITVDSAARTARCHDRELQLTAREFDLLTHFARFPDRVFSRVQLLQCVW
jgi:two-component system, OmpR family, response regulator